MQQKRLPELNMNEVQIADNIIQRTLDRLLKIYNGVSERGIKALFLTNGGGVVTVLAYLHNSSSAYNSCLVVSLCLFLIGLGLTVLLVGFDHYLSLNSLKNYNDNIIRYNNGKINLADTLIITNKCLTKIGKAIIPIGYVSAILFFIGTIFGMYGYIKYDLKSESEYSVLSFKVTQCTLPKK